MRLGSTLWIAALLTQNVSGLKNGVASTPPMGWNPYNAFLCQTTEVQYRNAAQRLVDLGLKDLGYQYVNLDCGWQSKSRNSTGGFMWDSNVIPSGIPALSSFIHGLGLKFGLYSDGGVFACDFVGGTAHYIGSLGHEVSDAITFSSWGADYLKYDNCYAVNATDFVDFNPPISIKSHYITMRDALLATRRPMVFSICEWGVQDPARWPASEIGNSWRISNDIGPPASWENLVRIINQLVPITQFAESGAWNDLDMLEVGNSGLTSLEQQTHFAFWAAAKSPLIISTDLTNPMPQTLNLLKNRQIIELNQDSLGRSISFRRRYTNDHDVWSGPLSDGSAVAVIINWQNVSRSLTFKLADIGLVSATATDLITGTQLGKVMTSYTTAVGAHGSLVLKFNKDAVLIRPTAFTFYPASSPTNTLAGGANTRVVNASTVVVGFVGDGGTLTFNNVDGGTAGGTKTLSFDYINADFVFGNTACSNCRNVFVSVNGETPVQAQMPISGQSWDIIFSGYLLTLPGFKPGRTNTVQLSNPTAFAPDFYRMGVEV